ncbi:MAG: hypothetical protein U0169_26925 [Polyangiaceae bacterium]
MLLPKLVSAQSVIVSVPSTDVTREGHVMLAHESQLNTWSQSKPYWNSFTFGTFGVGRNVEVAATLYGVSAPGSGNVAVAGGYKHRVPLARQSPWEPTVAFGQMIPVSLSGTGVGFWTYGVASVRLPWTRTRFTAGPSYGSSQIFGSTTVSMIAGIEQPVAKNLFLVADWFSGNHDLGALVPAVQWNVNHSFIVIAGVKIPNGPRGGVVSGLVELTYEFDVRPTTTPEGSRSSS